MVAGVRVGIPEAYRSAADRLHGMTLEQFDAATKEFEVTPLYYGGKCCGAVLVLLKEIHVCVTPPWYMRNGLRVLNSVIKLHGDATTHVDTEAGRRMVEKLGFIKDGEIYRKKTVFK